MQWSFLVECPNMQAKLHDHLNGHHTRVNKKIKNKGSLLLIRPLKIFCIFYNWMKCSFLSSISSAVVLASGEGTCGNMSIEMHQLERVCCLGEQKVWQQAEKGEPTGPRLKTWKTGSDPVGALILYPQEIFQDKTSLWVMLARDQITITFGGCFIYGPQRLCCSLSSRCLIWFFFRHSWCSGECKWLWRSHTTFFF